MCGKAIEETRLNESRNDEVEDVSDPIARLDRKDALGQDTTVEREALATRTTNETIKAEITALCAEVMKLVNA